MTRKPIGWITTRSPDGQTYLYCFTLDRAEEIKARIMLDHLVNGWFPRNVARSLIDSVDKTVESFENAHGPVPK